MKGIIGLILFLVTVCSSMFAQNYEEYGSAVISDARIDSLVQLHIEHNKKYPVVRGYRIQILMASGNDALDITEEAKSIFLEKYPDIPAYLTFDEPDYRVRVGDFRTRLDAERFLDKINRRYRGAWVIQDYINFPEHKNTNSYE